MGPDDEELSLIGPVQELSSSITDFQKKVAAYYYGPKPAAYQPFLTISTESEKPMLGLDFETRCELDITKVGLDCYVNHPSFEVLLACVSNDSSSVTYIFDFVLDLDPLDSFREFLENTASNLVAHNAPFEKAVIRRILPDLEKDLAIRDSAVIARMVGASSRLANAAPQLTALNKLQEGKDLIRKFSTYETYQGPARGMLRNDLLLKKDAWSDWMLFTKYCLRDAEASAAIAAQYPFWFHGIHDKITQRMNDVGWYVDMESVHLMWARYQENLEQLHEDFIQRHPDAKDLNLNSLPQMKKWCRDHGIIANSFDSQNVERLMSRISKKLEDPKLSHEKAEDYKTIFETLYLKQQQGGSSLSKLRVVMDTVSKDGRLRNQYMHVGAGQTHRTSGRGVQMQNLKRMVTQKDMATLADPAVHWTNDELAENMRQIFMAEDPEGVLIVGDFSSVEARALPYLAGEKWKVEAFADGKDMYKVQASDIFDVPYEEVTKEQRRTGKVGELSCGYGAGSGAVVRFAEGMSIDMSEEEAADLVSKWRESNKEIVELWDKLGAGFMSALVGSGQDQEVEIGFDMSVVFEQIATPQSLRNIHPGAQSMQMALYNADMDIVLKRVFHGCYLRGDDIQYYKASDGNKTLWVSEYKVPKTNRWQPYKLYGGKLAGILTQSFCREIFFDTLERLQRYVDSSPHQLKIVGQFHDEVIIEATPSPGTVFDVDKLIQSIQDVMSLSHYPRFPLAAEVHADRRYTK